MIASTSQLLVSLTKWPSWSNISQALFVTPNTTGFCESIAALLKSPQRKMIFFVPSNANKAFIACVSSMMMTCTPCQYKLEWTCIHQLLFVLHDHQLQLDHPSFNIKNVFSMLSGRPPPFFSWCVASLQLLSLLLLFFCSTKTKATAVSRNLECSSFNLVKSTGSFSH